MQKKSAAKAALVADLFIGLVALAAILLGLHLVISIKSLRDDVGPIKSDYEKLYKYQHSIADRLDCWGEEGW